MYSLKEIPSDARPSPTKKHRGEHSYTVTKAVVNTAGEVDEAVIDVLLRAKAFYIKRSPGGSGQIGWRKYGGPARAWDETLRQAVYGRPMSD